MCFVVADELGAGFVIEKRAGDGVLRPVAGDVECLPLVVAGVCIDGWIVREQRFERAVDDDCVCVAQGDELAIVVKDGVRVVDLGGRVDGRIVRIDRKPWRARSFVWLLRLGRRRMDARLG